MKPVHSKATTTTFLLGQTPAEAFFPIPNPCVPPSSSFSLPTFLGRGLPFLSLSLPCSWHPTPTPRIPTGWGLTSVGEGLLGGERLLAGLLLPGSGSWQDLKVC